MATTIPRNAACFTLPELAAAAGGDLRRLPDPNARVVGVVTDSRALAPGNGFVAVRGESFDGHDFVAKAVDRGATAVVVERGRVVPECPLGVIEVDDAVVAFGLIARAHLRRWRLVSRGARRVAALTGSAGKTTTKELVRAILSAVGSCHATTGNLNNRIGVPAVALALGDESYAVFELGMSMPGEISALARVVEPDVAALLNVGVAHAEGFGGSRDAIAREKGAILEALAAGGTAVVNADDELARSQLARTRARRVSFGTAAASDVRLVSRAPAGAGAHITVSRAAETIELFLAVVGEAAALDLVAAIAIADATVGGPVPAELIAGAVRRWQPPAGRSVICQLEGDVLVVDDSYNANPASMRAALSTLVELRNRGRHRAVAVLGEMRELGPLSEEAHDALGAELARQGIDLAIGCGGSVDIALRRAEAGGVAVRYAADAVAAGVVIAEEALPGDVVLFKGSRGAAVERALAALVQRCPVVPADKSGAT
jgi:UDP-N-acetylmuramoyl-tripeptide--D-alanyl-D-alanine ligase